MFVLRRWHERVTLQYGRSAPPIPGLVQGSLKVIRLSTTESHTNLRSRCSDHCYLRWTYSLQPQKRS